MYTASAIGVWDLFDTVYGWGWGRVVEKVTTFWPECVGLLEGLFPNSSTDPAGILGCPSNLLRREREKGPPLPLCPSYTYGLLKLASEY